MHAQQNNPEELLWQEYRQAATDSEKVMRLSPLINFYYAFNNEIKADSLRVIQVMAARETGSQTVLLSVMFPVYDNNININGNSSNDRFNKELGFCNQALEYAKSLGRNDYIALAYANIAGAYLNSGQPDLALKNADIAYTTAISSGNDSVKVITALELGKVFMQKKDMVMAFRKFSNAYDIANNLRNSYLLSFVYGRYSLLYKRLGSEEPAKEYIFKSIALNTKAGYIKGLIKDYISIGLIVGFGPGKNYLQRASLLADSLMDPVLKLQINQALFVQYMINGNSENTFRFLQTHPDVELASMGLGKHHYQWNIAEIFLYSKNYDSAYVYFKKAEPAYGANYTVSGRINFMEELANCCWGLKLYKEAIRYYTATLQMARTTLNVQKESNCLDALQQLYNVSGDYKKAYEYAHYYSLFRDSVNALNKDKDLVLLEIDNEKKRIQKENELEEAARQRSHDAQYMLISITVAVVFLLLVLLGLFTVSTTTIRVLGFFSFIFLFELITLLLDNWIHDKTHGEPWKIWIFKIGIISMLYPCHHWLEHKLIHYLLNKKLIHVGSIFSFRKLLNRFKKQTAPVEETTEAVEIIVEEKPEV